MSISFWNKNTHQETVLGGISGIFDRTKNGLVPQAPSGSGTSKYLREDGNWTVPPNDTKGNVISTYAAQSGAAQSAISTVINDDVHMDDVIKTLLNNDATLNTNVNSKLPASQMSGIIGKTTSMQGRKKIKISVPASKFGSYTRRCYFIFTCAGATLRGILVRMSTENNTPSVASQAFTSSSLTFTVTKTNSEMYIIGEFPSGVYDEVAVIGSIDDFSLTSLN